MMVRSPEHNHQDYRLAASIAKAPGSVGRPVNVGKVPSCVHTVPVVTVPTGA